MDIFNAGFLLGAQVLLHLDYHPDTHARVVRDAVRAAMAILLFTSRASVFFASKRGSRYTKSLLFRQDERSRKLPDCRSSTSCGYRGDAFYEPFDDARKKCGGGNHINDNGELPLEWDVAVRPKLALRECSSNAIRVK
jgi:hypothetical protein